MGGWAPARRRDERNPYAKRAGQPLRRSGFTVFGAPIPRDSALASAGFIYFLKEGNPVVWGFFPLVWLTFAIWLVLGLLLYAAYGRRKSTVALQEAEGLAIVQPRVN